MNDLDERFRHIINNTKQVQHKGGNQHTGICPCHDDKRNSLMINKDADKIVIYCQAGCDTEKIVDVFGLKMSDLFMEPLTNSQSKNNTEYLYYDDNGKLVHKSVRYYGKDGKKNFYQARPDGAGNFINSFKAGEYGFVSKYKDKYWQRVKKNVKYDEVKKFPEFKDTVLYNLSNLIKAVNDNQTVYIVEGEKDVENLKKIGLVATTNPMGAGKWKSHYNKYFTGAEVVILPDNDEPGRKHADAIVKGLKGKAKSIKVVELPDLQIKGDVSDWLSSGGTKEKLLELVEGSPVVDAKEICNLKPQNEGEPWIYYNGDKHIILPQILAEHIRTTSRYYFVKNAALDGVLRYWYSDGYYKLICDDELKGYIKEFIPLTLQKTRDINEVFNLLITDRKFISHEALNDDENIINFQNGLLHLDTMKLTEHTPDVISTIQIPCNYNPDALPSQQMYFDKLMEHLTSGNHEVKSLLLQFIGATISNIKGYKFKKALFMVGPGDSGKSKLKELTHRLLGEENVGVISLSQLEARFGTSRIYGKRLAGDGDMSFCTVKELEIFKKGTGGDAIDFEFKGKTGFKSVFNGLFWFCCNKLPKFGGDKGNWVYNRIMVCGCGNSVPEDKQDKHLLENMCLEREYIVQLALKELKKAIANNYSFIIPDEMIQATEQYKIDNDSFLRFLEECTMDRPFDKVTDDCDKKRLYDVYKAWCDDNNNGYCESKKNVKDKLQEMKMDDEKKVMGTRYYSKFTLTLDAKQEYKHVYGVDQVTKKYTTG